MGKNNGTFFPRDLSTDGTKVFRTLHQRVEPNQLYVRTTHGKFDIRIIHMSLSFSRSERLVPVSKFAEYSNPESALVQTAEWKLMDKGTLSLHRDLTSGQMKASVDLILEQTRVYFVLEKNDDPA